MPPQHANARGPAPKEKASMQGKDLREVLLSWQKQRPDDLRRVDRVIVLMDGRPRCLVCGERVVFGARDAHHRAHLDELEELLRANPIKPPPSENEKRAERRRWERVSDVRRTVELGEDPFHHVVKSVDPVTNRRRRRNRLRHPIDETLARVKELRDAGRMPAAIADETRLSLDYVRRLLRRLEGPK
jgi:hypothetical protein